MQVPVRVVFQNMEPSEALHNRILEKLDKLEHLHSRLVSCSVVVECAHRHQQQGRHYEVRIDLTLPGAELAASHHSAKTPARHEDPYAAMNDAFSALEKQLLHYKDAQRHH